MATRLAEMFGAGGAETFLGLPRWDGGAGPRAVILGADTATPYASVGAYCAGGAAAIRAGAADFAANLGHVNFDLGGPTFPDAASVADGGDVETRSEDPAGNRARIAGRVAEVIGAGAVPVLLGGDDSLPYPLIGAWGATGRKAWVVQVDAHIDWRDEVQGERLGLSSPMRRASEMAHVAGIVQIGQRGIGSARAQDLAEARAWGVRFHPMREIAAEGIGAALADVPAGAEVILCFDWDAMDQSTMPAVIARMPGGLGYWQAVELIAGIAGRARIVGMCFAEFMAAGDIDGIGARTAAQVVTAALGIVARAGTDV